MHKRRSPPVHFGPSVFGSSHTAAPMTPAPAPPGPEDELAAVSALKEVMSSAKRRDAASDSAKEALCGRVLDALRTVPCDAVAREGVRALDDILDTKGPPSHPSEAAAAAGALGSLAAVAAAPWASQRTKLVRADGVRPGPRAAAAAARAAPGGAAGGRLPGG